MADYQASTTFNPSFVERPAGRFLEQVFTVIDTLLQPGRLIADVESMGKLLAEAHRVEAQDPARAAHLRRLAAKSVR